MGIVPFRRRGRGLATHKNERGGDCVYTHATKVYREGLQDGDDRRNELL